MRTTVDLPDSLFRRVKAKAALEGVTLKALITHYLELGLQQSVSQPSASDRREPLPTARPRTGNPVPSLTGEEIEDLLLSGDVGDDPGE